MILRAVFWIAVVAVFIPHEPDLGFGRPSAEGFLPTKATDGRLAVATLICKENPAACANGLQWTDDLRSTILNNLERVKADLKQSRRAELEVGRRSEIGGGVVARFLRF
jgi:hypothetical protein